MSTQEDEAADPLRPDAYKGTQATMTARLIFRQFGFLFLAATFLLFATFFINFYDGLLDFGDIWRNSPTLQWGPFAIHSWLVIVYGYVFLVGILFALGPSERSFRLFFFLMMAALLAIHYDHSILDWFLRAFLTADIRPQNAVSVFKILFSCLFLVVIIVMHYNVLSDDFARRFLRRGVPTDEVARVRPGVFKVLVPTILSAAALATALGLLGELGQLIFRDTTFLPGKLQLFVLAGLMVPVAFLIRGILRDLAGQRKNRTQPRPNR